MDSPVPPEAAGPPVRLAKPIFVSYRRRDSPGSSGRLFDALRERYGAESVFFDVTDIEGGDDFTRAIGQGVADAGLLLAVVGPDWLRTPGSTGPDYVMHEVAAALRREIPVVPVLVEGATMPAADALPPEARALATRNALKLDHEEWDDDFRRLAGCIEEHVGARAAEAAVAVTVVKKKKPGCSVQVSVVVALAAMFMMARVLTTPRHGSSGRIDPSAGPDAPPEIFLDTVMSATTTTTDTFAAEPDSADADTVAADPAAADSL